MKASLLAVGLAIAASALAGAEVKIDSAMLVKPSDTVIDAIIAVKDAADAALAKDAGGRVTILPLPDTDARAASFNREMPWLANGKPLLWGGAPRTGGDDEDGSHLFRTEKRRDGKNHPWWYERMKEKRDEIRASGGAFDIVMLGDSITHWWDRDYGRETLSDLRRTYRMLNLGYGGDKADTLLWRVRNGELDGYRAKLFTIMVGTNNQAEGRDTPERTAATIGEIVATIRAKQPQAKVLLMAVFPRTSPEQGRLRARSMAVSRLIERYADGKDVVWCDFRPLFVKEDGTGRYDLLEDGTHPSPTGVRVWRDALLPHFELFTGKRHVPADKLRPPCARRWIACRVDPLCARSCERFNEFVVRAQWMGYNGICVDAFDAVGTWDDAAQKRMKTAGEACRDADMAFVPVLRQQEDAAFAATLESVKAAFDPSAVFIATNGAACATREALRPAVVRQVGMVAKILPKAEVVLYGRPFAGYAAGIPPSVTMAANSDIGYYRSHKWPTMLLVDAEDKYVHQWSLHVTISHFMRAYQCQGPREGLLYWTSTGDYRTALDAVRLAMRQE